MPLAVKIEQELLKDIEPAELAQRRRVMARLSQSATTRLPHSWRALIDDVEKKAFLEKTNKSR